MAIMTVKVQASGNGNKLLITMNMEKKENLSYSLQ